MTRIAPEIASALAAGRPVVALESTIIAHGMPFPGNLETARALEADVRGAGAVPATIAILGGEVRVGLDAGELEHLARAGGAMAKASARDIAALGLTGGDGATTVAGTMAIAHRVGIKVFATGGIGGVHRGVESSYDVSADLHELARTPVAVVSAGAKAILDLPKTLEMLDTLGVPVVGMGCDEFPAFWARSSGLKLDARCDDAAAVARLIERHWAWGRAGILIANPIPAADAIDRAVIEAAIEQALAAAAREGVSGKPVTPFLLARVLAATGGKSLPANIALARNNARVAARIAAALSS